MQARALDSTNRVDLLASFEREPTKIPSSSKLTKELLSSPMTSGQINNSAYSCFLASSFIRLSSPPGFAGSIYTYGSCVSYKYCTSDRVLCDTICSRLQSNRYDVCAPNQLKVFKTWFVFFTQSVCAIGALFFYIRLSQPLSSPNAPLIRFRKGRKRPPKIRRGTNHSQTAKRAQTGLFLLRNLLADNRVCMYG